MVGVYGSDRLNQAMASKLELHPADNPMVWFPAFPPEMFTVPDPQFGKIIPPPIDPPATFAPLLDQLKDGLNRTEITIKIPTHSTTIAQESGRRVFMGSSPGG
jgi:hypothetical protein